MLINLCEANNYKSIFPPIELCGDNAAMIAMVGLEKYKLNEFNTPGSAIIFPSFINHKVNKITSGRRNTLAIWLSGPKFR